MCEREGREKQCLIDYAGIWKQVNISVDKHKFIHVILSCGTCDSHPAMIQENSKMTANIVVRAAG